MYEQLELLATSPAPADRRTSPPWELLCYAPAGDVAGAIAADAPRFKRRSVSRRRWPGCIPR